MNSSAIYVLLESRVELDDSTSYFSEDIMEIYSHPNVPSAQSFSVVEWLLTPIVTAETKTTNGAAPTETAPAEPTPAAARK